MRFIVRLNFTRIPHHKKNSPQKKNVKKIQKIDFNTNSTLFKLVLLLMLFLKIFATRKSQFCSYDFIDLMSFIVVGISFFLFHY